MANTILMGTDVLEFTNRPRLSDVRGSWRGDPKDGQRGYRERHDASGN